MYSIAAQVHDALARQRVLARETGFRGMGNLPFETIRQVGVRQHDNDPEADDDMQQIAQERLETTPLYTHVKGAVTEGVDLDEAQRQYLQPHFFQILIGKPGSGKTTLIENLVNNEKLYGGKFNRVLVISPSIKKMTLNIRKSNQAEVFDIEWVYKKIHQLNEKQMEHVSSLRDAQDTHMEGTIQARLTKSVQQGNTNDPLSLRIWTKQLKNLNKHRSPHMHQLSKLIRGTKVGIADSGPNVYGVSEAPKPIYSGLDASRIDKPTKRRVVKRQTKEGMKLEGMIEHVQEYANEVNEMYKQFMPDQELQQSKKNMLIILDDVISDVKELEFNAAMTKLFLNRRHLIANGTISIVLASQKYTMIPSRIRTNSNQVVAFRLNPKDLEKLKEDHVDFNDDLWDQVKKHVFGADPEQLATNNKFERTYDFLNMWTDERKVFKNFDRFM